MERDLLFGFDRELIMEHCKKLKSTDEQIKYLRLVLKEYKTNPPDLDPNYGLKPRLIEYLKTEIEFRKELLEDLKKTETTKKVETTVNDPNLNKEMVGLNNELASAQNILIRQRNKIKFLEKGITESGLIDVIEKNKCRFSNGKINYSSLGKIMGCSHHTAKNKCKFFGIK